MAVKEYPKAVTVKRGPAATGNDGFAFRAYKNRVNKDGKEIENSGDIVVGDSPVEIKLDTEDAKRIGLPKTVMSMIQKGYLIDINAPPRKPESTKGV